MEYAIGLLLAPSVFAFAHFVGLARDRAFYPTVMIVIAAYYVLVAAIHGSGKVVLLESIVASGFTLLAVVGFKKNLWWAAAAIAGHGVFDIFQHLLIENPGVPVWWPGFCSTFDLVFGALIGWGLLRRPINQS